MKSLSCSVLIALTGLASASRAAAVDETNQVAIAILSYAAMDNEDNFELETEQPVRYSSWNGLLDAVSFPGMSRQDKEAALLGYLMGQSTNNLDGVDGETRELIRVGLCECRDLNYTNALPIVRNFATNPTACFMDEPIYIYYKWAAVDDDFLDVTRSFLCNTSAVCRAAKAADFLFVESSIARHKRRFGADGDYTNVLKVVYQSRKSCPECAIDLDRMLSSEIRNYAMSSNRMEALLCWIDSKRCSSKALGYCSAVTNQLLNASHPLSGVSLPD